MHDERVIRTPSGWPMLVVNLVLLAAGVATLIFGGRSGSVGFVVLGILLVLAAFFVLIGYYVVAPNQSAVLILFGKYRGSVKENGFWWTNPFMQKIKVSLRARTLNGEKLKVNEASGNPIEIAAVVVWRVRDTAHAQFEVDDYVGYVTTQSEAAVRKLASSYPYDGPENQMTLRGAPDEINHHLQRELQERLDRAGVETIEARLSHLAYAPEIAGAMLQRQQAQAIVDARTKIVEGAVGMVDLALSELSRAGVVELDDERKAAMVSNLMVVLCADQPTQPVVNTGTLYP
jgi:regulator of protease activity HflC (stomatin/prohibitin superfamily)